MAILDHLGRPIQSAQLREPQTARVAQLHQEFAGHPARGLTPARLATIMGAAEQNDLRDQMDLSEDMEERDAHLHAELAKRKRALLTLDWDVVPPRNAAAGEKKQADLAKEILLDLDINQVILDAADAILAGFACLEIEWERPAKSEWLPRAITHRPPRWFTLDRETRTEIRLRDASGEGEPLNPFGWIVHRHQAKSGYIARGGLVRVLAWPYLFKNYAVRDLAEFLEIYGLPLRVGKYPPGATDKEKATLLQAVVNIGHNAAGIIPEGMALEFNEAAKGTHDPFQVMIDWCERSESKALLGQTLSAESASTGLGSGVANLHGEVRHDLLDSDAQQLGRTLTRDLVFPLLALNAGGIESLRRCPRFTFDTQQPEDIKLYAESVPKLVDVGVSIPVSWVREKLQIPEPEGDEPVLARAAAPERDAAGDDAGPPGGARRRPAARERGDDARGAARLRLLTAALAAQSAPADDEIDRLVDEALEDWEPAMDDLVGPIRQALDEAIARGESLEQFRATLARLLPALDTTRLAERLARAAFVARLAGEADVDP